MRLRWKPLYQDARRQVEALERTLEVERAAHREALRMAEAARRDQQATIERLLEAREKPSSEDLAKANMARLAAELESQAEGRTDELERRIGQVWEDPDYRPKDIVWLQRDEGDDEAA